MTSVWRIRMRKYKNQKEKKLAEIYCNGCGKKITIKNEMIQEGMFHGEIFGDIFQIKIQNTMNLIYVKRAMIE